MEKSNKKKEQNANLLKQKAKEKMDKTGKKHKVLDWFYQNNWTVVLWLIVFLFLFQLIGLYFAVPMGALVGTMIADILFAGYAFWLLGNNGYQLFKKSEIEPKKLTKKQWLIVGVTIAIIFVLVYFLGQLFGTAINLMGDKSFKQYQTIAKSVPGMMTFMALFIAPVSEELIYRGVIYGSFKQHMSVLNAAVFASLVFALMHGTLTHLPGTFALAMLNILVLELTGKFRYPILLHMIYNWGATLNLNIALPKVLFSLPVAGSLYGLLVALLVGGYFYMQIKFKPAISYKKPIWGIF